MTTVAHTTSVPIREHLQNDPRLAGYYLVSDAAKKVGRSKDTLVRWRKTGTFSPDFGFRFGDMWVPLYSEDDIVELRKIKRTIKPGRKAHQ